MVLGILIFQFVVFIITLIVLFAYLKLSHKFHWFDKPDESRKLHNKVVPTSAGLIFMLPVIVFFGMGSISQPFDVKLIASIMTVLLLLGGWDDFKPMTAKIRLFVIITVSSYFCYKVFIGTSISYLLLAVYLIGLIWWLNLYNFMDGADGMAGLHALITAGGYALAFLFLPNGINVMAFYILMFAFGLLAFLFFNFPKAKMFMGDAGSLSVAFGLSVFSLYGISNNVFGELLVISFHLVFIIDTTLTLFARLFYKQSITQAHSLHLYQWLIHDGKSHARVSMIYAIATLALVLVTLYLHHIQANFMLKFSSFAIESIILTIIWFYFQNKTKFKQFQQ